jgi:pyruvate formate lyase activating enzyme
MKISGIEKNSFIDFPKKIACTIFTQGCNFRCPYCHNPDLIPASNKTNRLFDTQYIFSFLERRKKFIQGVVITGGEPTLQDDILLFCEKIKGMGYKIKLDTNGSNPEILSALFEKKLIDFVSMDIKTNLENYNAFLEKNSPDIQLNIERSIQLIKEKISLYEFRTTCTKFFIDKAIIKNIGKMIKGASLYTLQQCSRKIKVLDNEFLKQDNNFFFDEQIFELKNIVNSYVKRAKINENFSKRTI